MYLKFTILAVAGLSLSACVSVKNYESPPVKVSTAQGEVTCQLYTKERLDWDRSISRPETMSAETADIFCKNEGLRRKQE